MSELNRQLEFAITTAHEAGRLTLGYFDRELLVEAKADESPVTVADREAERLIRERIERSYPQHAVLGEEFGGAVEEGASHRWIVDPIDGTKSFIRGVPLYAVLLALEVEGEVRVGVCHFPALGETVWAASGMGCFRNGRRCHVSPVGELSQAFVGFTNAASFAAHGRAREWAAIGRASAFTAGWSDAYGHALVASGRLEVMLDPIMSPWDCGPFAVILPEAGGYFGNWSGQSGIYGNEALSVNSALREEVLRTFAAVADSEESPED